MVRWRKTKEELPEPTNEEALRVWMYYDEKVFLGNVVVLAPSDDNRTVTPEDCCWWLDNATIYLPERGPEYWLPVSEWPFPPRPEEEE